ncbi:MAG: PIN domain-containing protein [Synergistaceae bacterium]|jgi:predicted nucleic acid-binding protein|nr:PIN domain-containing protein [Synergistaceae bacterium]
MKKLKIYIDTSVISHLQHDDAPERTKETLSFWKKLKTGKYEIVISDLTLREIRHCPQPKQTDLIYYLGEIECDILPDSGEVKALAEAYMENGILTRKSENDCMHIAFASTSECEVIVSWNFKHMVRLKTIQGVRIANAKNGYFKPIDILQPTALIGGDEDERTGDQS